MKLRPLLTLCAALLALSPGPATAQTTSAVPNFISYQGRVVDASGNNVGAVTPVNRTVIFRIWNTPSSTNAANLIYSEAQTVTVSDGEFSVLVGQGVANPTGTFGYNEADKKLSDLGTAFNGSDRYLGVTVAAMATIATTDNEITPRQQIVSTAFAMRAKFAESIGSSSDLALTPLSGTASNYGLGWYGTGRPFGTTAVDGPVLYGNAGGALGSNVSGTRNTALRWDASGRVGIGATSISSATNKLTLQGDMTTSPADQLTIRGNDDNNKRLLLGYNTTANKASLQSYTAATTTGQLLLNPSGGNVGIGTTTPSAALDVAGSARVSGDLNTSNIVMDQGTVIAGKNPAGVNENVFWPRFGNTTYLNYGSDGFQIRNNNNLLTMSMSNAGNVGIGTPTPNFPLTLSNTLGDKIALNTNPTSGLCYGLGVQNSLFQIHTDQVGSDIAFGYGSSAIMVETMRIKGNGRVGIGTKTPSVALDVTGAIAASTTITAGGKSVPTTDENNLKIIRGTVRKDGTVWAGNGYSVVKVAGTGLYQITFTTPFASSPSVTTSITGRFGVKAEVYNAGRTDFPLIMTDALYPGMGGFTVGIVDATSTNSYDFGFSFIAIGPR